MTITLYDTTLRDGTQGEGLSFSVDDKLKIARKLDEFGLRYIEGGWPGSNPKDMAFFAHAQDLPLRKAIITAFGSTRRADRAVEEDDNIRALVAAGTRAVAIFGKSWDLHVHRVLDTRLDENLCMIADSVGYLKAQGREVTTVEGLAPLGELHLLQKSFVEHGAVQCGYCTPGMLMSAKALLDRNPNPTEDDIRLAISGNLCRCTGYAKIVEAIKAAISDDGGQ